MLGYLNTGLRVTETCLDIVGYIPYVGSKFSAPVRAGLGNVMLLTGLVAAGVFGAMSLFSDTNHARYKQYAFKALEYAAHGALNIGRSMIESIPFLSIITCFPYDIGVFGRKILDYTDDYRIAFQGRFNRAIIASPSSTPQKA